VLRLPLVRHDERLLVAAPVRGGPSFGQGVEFLQEPAERPYGIEAAFRDNSGNWFSLTQRTGL
jgi:hypothetical protein